MLLQNTSRVGNCVIIMGRSESDGPLKENDHEITINKAKLKPRQLHGPSCPCAGGCSAQGCVAPRWNRLQGTSSVVAAHVHVTMWPFCTATSVSLPWPQAGGISGEQVLGWLLVSCPFVSRPVFAHSGNRREARAASAETWRSCAQPAQAGKLHLHQHFPAEM